MRNIQLNVGKYELKTQYGASWIKLYFQHFDSSEDSFEKAEDALEVFNEKQYSILLEASQWPHDQPYEFLLQYPELPGFNRWKQTNFPLNESDDLIEKTAEGFENISCTWTTNYWGGLQTGNRCSLLEGSAGHRDWYYAIGPVRNCEDWSRCVPGPGRCVYTVYLWMRIPDIILLHYCTFPKHFFFRPQVFTFIFFLS